MKKAGYIKKGVGRGYHVITAKGKNACAKLVAEADAAQTEEGAPAGEAGQITTDDLVLVAIQNAGGTLLGTELGKAVIGVGYNTGDQSTEETGAELKGALSRLKDTGLIQFTKDGKQRTQFVTTTAGNKRLAEMA